MTARLQHRRSVRQYLALAGLVAFAACADAEPEIDDDADAAQPEAAATNDEEATGLASLRAVTAGFTDIEAARAAGYTDQITPCWYHRDNGGQGYHFGRSALIDGNVSASEPELVMYEPRPDGTMEFIGIEYIVPFAQWQQTEPPRVLGQPMMRNEELELWVMHVWLGKDNPNGMYAPWNPNVTCEHAAESEDRA